MSKISCTRRLQWCAGHRVYGHENKCGHLHGHNYVGYFTAEADELDDKGRVIDFSVLKLEIGAWIDYHWDHGFLYHKNDFAVENILDTFEASNGDNQKAYALPYNPTAENIAKYLIELICPSLFKDYPITITKVVIHETENCVAEAIYCEP